MHNHLQTQAPLGRLVGGRVPRPEASPDTGETLGRLGVLACRRNKMPCWFYPCVRAHVRRSLIN